MNSQVKKVIAFPFIKYVSPYWYFNLQPDAEEFSSIAYNHSTKAQIPPEFSSFFEIDSLYKSETARNLDIGFRAVAQGVMLTATKESVANYDSRVTLEDNYVFLRKYFKPKWSLYVLLRRIFTFKNPVKEFMAYKYAKKATYFGTDKTTLNYDGYRSFKSKLVEQQPLVSIIIPTLNRYEYLKDVITDLQNQDYKNYEIIIVDQTDAPQKDFYKQFDIDINVIFQKEKGQWLARNTAIRASKGDYLLFFDDDSRVDANWVAEHLKGLDFFNADISAGVSISKVGMKVPENYSFFRWADQFDSGNAMVKRDVIKSIGMFDRQFDKQRMGDGEFGLRAYLAGFKSISHPYAKRLHLKVGTGGLRQIGSWDGFRPKKIFAPRPIPSVIYLYRKYFPPGFVANALILNIFPALVPYKWKHKAELYPVAVLLGIILLPVILLQFSISYSRANKMILEGDKIEWL